MTSAVSEIELAPNEKRCSKCKEVKDRSEFNRSKRNEDGLERMCKICNNKVQRERKSRRRLRKDDTCISCPECGGAYSNLLSHVSQAHGLSANDLANIGINNYISSFLRKKHSLSIRGPRPQRRKGDYADMLTDRISFPEKYWPPDCNYVKIKVVKERLQVHFNPINKLHRDAKLVEQKQWQSHRVRINVPPNILGQLNIFRPVFELRTGAGFYIQFYEQDETLLKPFELWAKNGNCLKNLSDLTTFSYWKKPFISIPDHIWPLNAEYVYPEWHPSKRSNGINYLDLIPVSRTGFIIGSTKLNSKQYMGFDGCSKLILNDRRRLRASFVKFIRENNIPGGDWYLKEVLPSGALRFRLYKERQPKEQSEDIAS